MTMAVRAVVFDLGETLLDETELWGAWADALRVPRFTFFAVAGALIERGEHPSRAVELFGPEAAEPSPYVLSPTHLYRDAVPCLQRLRDLGYTTAVAGNQPTGLQEQVSALGLPVDVVTSSAELRVEKPEPVFFARLAARLGLPPQEVAYVGDRVDNDIVPAADAGLVAVLVRRGPWVVLQAAWPEASRAHATVDSLAEVPDVVAGPHIAVPS
jgi:FMN phosphatase YigB (HAD superfamily)